MAAKLTALIALASPAAAVWMVQSPSALFYPEPHYNSFFRPHYNSFFLPSTSPFDSFFDRRIGARYQPAVPYTNLLSRPRASDLSSALERLVGEVSALDGLWREDQLTAPSWKEIDENVVAHLIVRGLKAEQLKAEVSDGVLTFSGSRECDACKSVVSRSLSLPFELTDTSKISLSLASNGVLTVSVPKAARAPDKVATPLQVVAAEPVEKKTEALPSPSPEAVEADTLRQLESKFPHAPAPPPETPSTDAEKKADDHEAAMAAEPTVEQRSATQTLRKVVHTAIGATSMATTTGGDHEAKNSSLDEAAKAVPNSSETRAAA